MRYARNYISGFLALVFSTLFLPSAFGQFQFTCGTEPSEEELSSSGLNIPTSGDFRAIIIFVRFSDDTYDPTCTIGHQGWPHSQLEPDYADDFLAPTTNPPFDGYYLTKFYYDQSQANFTLYGDEKGVVVGKHEEYRDPNVTSYEHLDIGKLSRDAMDALDPTLDFSQYDANEDGYIDHVFIVIRRNMGLKIASSDGATGYSRLGFYYSGGAKYDGMKVHSRYSGSVNKLTPILPQMDLTTLLAHEFGHDIWNKGANAFFNHLNPIGFNYVPFDPPLGEDHYHADRMVGYALMLGSGSLTEEVAASNSMSAYERYATGAGWIDCPELSGNQTVALGDVYTTGGCRRLTLGTGRRLFFSNLQRVSYFDQNHTATSGLGAACPDGCQQLEEVGGNHTTGLLVELVKGERRDVLPADNSLETLNVCHLIADDGESVNDTYFGDLYSAETKAQITPWTRPNVTGCTSYLDGSTCDVNAPLTWAAIDNIRYTGGANGEMAFDYVEDFRTQPIIRADSWIGTEVASYTFNSSILVKSGATLTVTSNATLNFGINADLVVEDGAQLIVKPGVTMNFAQGGELQAYGEIDVDGATFTSATTWTGVNLSGAGADESSLLNSAINNAMTGIYAEYMDNLYLEDVTITGSSYYAVHAVSLSADIYYSELENAGWHGIRINGGSVYLFNSTIQNNGLDGINATYANTVTLGGHGDQGYNVVRSNGGDGIHFYSSSANLGDVFWVGQEELYAGYNSIYGNIDYDLRATNASEVLAEKNWWGESPPSASDFYITANSTLDNDPWLTSDPNNGSSSIAGVSANVKSAISPSQAGGTQTSIAAGDATQRNALYNDVSIGAFVRQVHEMRETQGRARATSFLKKIGAASNRPIATVATILRLGDLVYLGRLQEAVTAGEALLEHGNLSDEAKTLIGRALLRAYQQLPSSETRVAHIVNLLMQSGDPTAAVYVQRSAEARYFKELKEGIKAARQQETLIDSYPNPFEETVTIRYVLAQMSPVELTVYDLLGRKVAVLVNTRQAAGSHRVIFDGSNLSEGIYLYRLRTNAGIITGRMTLQE